MQKCNYTEILLGEIMIRCSVSMSCSWNQLKTLTAKSACVQVSLIRGFRIPFLHLIQGESCEFPKFFPREKILPLQNVLSKYWKQNPWLFYYSLTYFRKPGIVWRCRWKGYWSTGFSFWRNNSCKWCV